MKPTRKTYPLELLTMTSDRELRRNSNGRPTSAMHIEAPNAARMWDVTDAAETCHGLRNLASRFFSLAEVGAMVARFDTERTMP